MTDTTNKPVDPRTLAKSAVVAVPKVDGQKLVMRMPAIQRELDKPHGITQLGTVISKEEALAKTCVEKAVGGDIQAIKAVFKQVSAVPVETKKIVPEIAQPQKDTEKTEKPKTNLGEYAVKGGPGRPRKENSIDTAIQDELNKAHAITADGSTLTKNQMIAKAMVEKAVNGDIKAAVFVAERSEGKAMQKIQVVAPEDMSGTVISKEAEERLDELFGRK